MRGIGAPGLATLLGLVLLAACNAGPAGETANGPEPEVQPPLWRLCDGRVVKVAPGTPVDQIDIDYTAGPIRVLWPGVAGTTDYLPMRLNLHLDAERRFLRLDCN